MTNTITKAEMKDLVDSARRHDRMNARLAEAGVEVETTSHEIVVRGNTYPVKDALKAVGFRWSPSSKSWRYDLITYKNLRFRRGLLHDGTVIRHPWPQDWRPAACRALAEAN